MKPIIVIPARGGSKGIPRKNIKLLNGRPLIQYTIEAARAVFVDDQIFVSTEDAEIKSIVESIGLTIPILRPDYLATDTSGTYEVLLHAIEFYENSGYHPDTLILLQATSPFRTAEHIKEALTLYDTTCEMVVSVKETNANPYYVLREENENGWLVKSKQGNYIRRQDCPKVYELNGAIYIIDIATLKSTPLHNFSKVRKYVMDDLSSHDIDNQLDWMVAEAIIQKKEL